MLATLVFLIPFWRPSNREWTSKLGRTLELRMKRTDDWDDLLGSRLVGESGAIRLYRMDITHSDKNKDYFELRGIAMDHESRRLVAEELNRCREALAELAAKIDASRLVDKTSETQEG